MTAEAHVSGLVTPVYGRRVSFGAYRPGRLCPRSQVVGARARLRRRSAIGALPVVVMLLAYRDEPGTYPVAEAVARAVRFGPRSALTVDTDRPPR